jgi:hypothetical protein
MYEFLRDSTNSAKYTMQDTKDGPCDLKAVIFIKYYVETKATNYHLRQKLQHLPKAIIHLKHDIAAFNDHVRELIQDLADGGEMF